jgi:histidine ammonia-lyase
MRMLELDGHRLTLGDVVRAARERTPARVAPDAMRRVAAARAFLERCVAEGRRIYGVNTGIGHLAHVTVPSEDLEELQRNIVRSHAAGVGPPLADDEVRAILLLKINLFAKGHSGVRPALVERLSEMLARDVLPVIPAKGSLGASGDLAPLAHVALALIGEGEARLAGRTLPAGEALRAAGIAPFTLSYKEGLGVINGCQVMAGRGVLLWHDATILLKTAQLVSAAVLDVLGASGRALDARVHRVRPYPGQVAVAANLRRLLAGERRASDRVQDAYSLRCVPQILGGVADAFDDVERRLAVEVNAASDNPLVFPEDEEIVAAGNFHGESLALSLDAFGAAVAEIGSLAERQVNRLLNPVLSGLPAFLAPDTGRNSGLMIMQYSAASLVSENKVLAHPASVDSIPVSADQEDHASMGATAAHKAAGIVANVADVLGVAALAAAQAMDLRQGPFADASRAMRERIRADVPFWKEDRYASADMAKASHLVRSGELLAAVEERAGVLG